MADPRTLPRLQAQDVTYLGKWTVPGYEDLDYTAAGLIAADGNRCLYVGNGGQRPMKVAVLEIPAFGGVAKVLTKATPVANIEAISADPNKKMIGGGMFWQGRVKLACYAYYDGNGKASASHFDMAENLTDQKGPYRVGTVNPGMTGQYMGTIPAEWQTLLGGPAFTGAAALAIIGRSSLGPSAHVLNPSDIGNGNPVPSTPLVYYPHDHPTAGTWEGVSQYYTGADTFGGAFFVPGTRSLVFVSGHGTAAHGCYGYGTLDQSLVGTRHPDGTPYCYDGDANKGPKAYPYVPYMLAYDANDLLEVKEGRKQPWDILPYATWIFGADSPLIAKKGIKIIGATLDPSNNRLYVSTGSNEVFVFQVTAGSVAPPPPPPPDVDCVEVATEWGPWRESGVPGQEERSRTWTQVTPKGGNGRSCAWTDDTHKSVDETEFREAPPPPPTSYDATIRSITAYADKDAGLTVRIDSNGPLPLKKGQKIKITVVP